MFLVQDIGDLKTHDIAMSWGNRPFVPGDAFELIWTLKATDADVDALAKVQKMTGYGISVAGRNAKVTLIPIDTAGGVVEAVTVVALSKGIYYWDLQAKSVTATSDIRTVAKGIFYLERDVTRGVAPTIPIYVYVPPGGGIPILAYLDPDGAAYTDPDGEYYTAPA